MKTTLLTDAEQSLQDNRYQQAIIAYERYREQFPNDPALEQIESKIEQIRDLQKVSLEMK
ncbi:MAG: hypothetical protein GWN13_07440, partial [Phycisphaerae bacterium]|nr:hypothetical protein [Phycisphaerae bacterium]